MPPIAVISDTHGALDLEKLQMHFPVRCRAVTLGDVSGNDLALVRGHFDFLGGVKGNCDTKNSLPETMTMMIDGMRCFLSHEPPKIRVPSRKMNAEEGYDIVFFGHLHRRIHLKKDGLIYFSPGAYSGPRDKQGPSVGMIEITNGVCACRFVDIA